MGDPKKSRKKYTKPSHPWQRDRMEKETQIRKLYGVRRKREIWKMDSIRKNFTNRVKSLIAARTEQANKEREQVVQKLVKLGLIDLNAKFDDILGLTLESVMERRLQTIVWKNGMAKSPQQARQFIGHGHVIVGGKKITSPSYLVPKSQEAQIGFLQTSAFVDTEHPERLQKKSEASSAAKEQKRARMAERAKMKGRGGRRGGRPGGRPGFQQRRPATGQIAKPRGAA